MPAPFSCGKVIGMKTTAATLTVLALAAPAAAQASECTYHMSIDSGKVITVVR